MSVSDAPAYAESIPAVTAPVKLPPLVPSRFPVATVVGVLMVVAVGVAVVGVAVTW